MKITLKDGSVKEYAQSKSVIEIAEDISEGLARAATAGKVNGEVVDLRNDGEDEDEDANRNANRSASGNGKRSAKCLHLHHQIHRCLSQKG